MMMMMICVNFGIYGIISQASIDGPEEVESWCRNTENICKE
jgi:hypothetical protein